MKTFENELEYLTAKSKHDAYNFAAMEYRVKNKTNGIKTEICDTFPFADEVDNDLRSAIEEWEFRMNPPDKYFIYISRERAEATTWTGQKLGLVSFGREFRSNMGDNRVPITVNAINGKIYHGTFFKSAGDYARIKLAKS